MAVSNDTALRELSILTSAYERVFRKLIRLLIGRISLKRIQEMIQVIFVEEAEEKLKQQGPNQNVTLNDLAMLADVDTRTIKKARSYIALSMPFHQNTGFLSELVPEASVIDVWGTSSNYTDQETGKPRPLKIRGPGNSFESLIKESTTTAGVDVEAFIQHLLESESIELIADETEVQLVGTHYTSFASKDQSAGLKVGLAAVSNLLDTITHNLLAPAQGDKAFYQRGCWTTRLGKEDRDKLRTMTKRFLLKSDEKASELIEQYERGLSGNEQITAGISMFYFEEERVV
jgi:hypothetical protein